MALLPGAEPFRHDGGPVGVVCCHGFTGSPHSMRPWAEHLAQAGYTVEAPRLPGHGTRWQDLNDTRWQDWYGELERTYLRMLDRCERVYVAGLSMGGTLTLRLAQCRRDIAGIVLVNPSVMTLRRDAKLLPIAGRLGRSVSGIGSDIKKPTEGEFGYDRTPLRAAWSLSQLWKLVRADLPAVRTPMLLFTSRVDHVVEPVNSQMVLDRVSSTDVTHQLLDNSYHVATLDYDAPTIFASSTEWIGARSLSPTEEASV